MIRHRRTHRFGPLINQLRIFQQRRATAAAVDQLGRAAAVEIDAIGPEFNRTGGVFRQPLRILAQQLDAHQGAGRRAAGMMQFGAQAIERFGG
ncbi:hypothetical protein D3C72_2096210 [compost metagenome]